MDALHFAGPEQSIPGRTSRPSHLRRRWEGDLCVGWALASAAAVPFLALLLPIETGDSDLPGVQPRYSLYHMDGPVVFLPAAIPLVVAVLVGLVLYAGRHGSRRWTRPVAWTLSGALLGAAVVGFLTILIGVFVIPTAGLLIAATSLSRATTRR